ncbi:MAG: hypothetical protein OEZ01_02820 [Candidatus Heimdallarchaeota archaeon]|nr:hypothetical protein [Candidatus Heimdallarchaeota archaeon]MDH5644910.1 hypothetical protein [Candidatus Heimdallarchaeota archaeon]
MKLENRVKYISFLIIGVLFLIIGNTLDELDIIKNVLNASFDEWYVFMLPWLGSAEEGIPTPW